MDLDDTGDIACSSQRKRVTSDGAAKMRKRGRDSGDNAPNGGKRARTHRSIILEIRMKNFLSYENHSFQPGPKLNLILGVNGAGKSTINNAICIGLGFDAKLLDRCAGVDDFIKRGATEGSVEIHLSRPGGNVAIVRAELKRGKRSADFSIDGRQKKNRKEVLEFAKGLGINLDNLCHFLPQEKVVHFASLAGKPAQMLEEVEKAVGPPQMMKDHEELIKLTETSSSRIEHFETLKARLEDLKIHEQDLAQELQRFERMKELEKSAEHVEWKQLIVRANIAKEAYKAKKGEEKEVADKMSELEKKYNQLVEEKKRVKDDATKAKQQKEEKERKVHRAREDADAAQGECLDGERDARSALKKIADLEVRRGKLNDEIRQKEQEVEDLKVEKANFVVPPDIDRQISHANDLIRQAGDLCGRLQDDEYRLRNEYQDMNTELQGVETEIGRFVDSKTRKVNALRSSNLELARAYDYLAQNQSRFDQTVYGPIMLELDVQGKENAVLVESCLGPQMCEGFITQSEHDFKLLHEMMNQPNSPVKTITVYKAHREIRKPSTSQQQWAALEKHGITRHLIDSVSAPDAVMSVITNTGGLHNAYVGSERTYDNWQRVLDDPALKFQNQNTRKFQHVLHKGCFTKKGRFSATFSVHGSQAMLPKAQEISRSTRIVAVNDDQQLGQLQARRAQLQHLLAAKNAEWDTCKAESAAAALDLGKKQQTLSELRKLKNKDKKFDADIKHKMSIISDLKKQNPMAARPKHERDQANAEQKMMRAVARCQNLAAEVSRLQREIQALEAQNFDVNARYREIEAQVRQEGEVLYQAKQQVNALRAELDRLKKELDVAKKRRSETVPSELSEEETRALQELPDSEEELEQRIDDIRDEQERLGVSTDRRQEYEDTKAEIADVEGKIEVEEDNIKHQDDRISRLKERWLNGDEEGELYPPLQLDGSEVTGGLKNVIAIINKEFSGTFEAMGNVGEVRLREAKTEGGQEDFRNYAIEILVKFRKTQELQRLDGQVQSGGETSLSTMLFLVSLQQITECPFRLVDEINQGMDQQYEKAVFDRIVKWSCRDDTAQTFLITPKLAPGLLDSVEEKLENDDDLRVLVACKGVELSMDMEGIL